MFHFLLYDTLLIMVKTDFPALHDTDFGLLTVRRIKLEIR